MPAYLLPGVPVVQPPHLEGDATLATEILPGPPSAATVQHLALKRDPKKPSMAYSYLPPSDPGSTYSGIMHGTLIGLDPEGARSKRAKDKGCNLSFSILISSPLTSSPLLLHRTLHCEFALHYVHFMNFRASGRAQRASARQQGSNLAPVSDSTTTLAPTVPSAALQPVADSETTAMMVDEDLTLSRSASSVNLQDPPLLPTATKTKRKDKGKGKEVETLPLRVKEEPKTLSLQTPEPTNNLVSAACQQQTFFTPFFCSSTTRIIVPHVLSQASWCTVMGAPRLFIFGVWTPLLRVLMMLVGSVPRVCPAR